ncbi:hyphally regulated cell wall protein 1-like [Helicoverpa zea]|uniref:hyphally regulated cell wall protein 1-like n=1 Tax=Helicoverpa zea TaxID=7113 RepID=UPI001F578A9A|nr:hyphally regulated cell wall protein 1-like [Helicoverpa zea]
MEEKLITLVQAYDYLYNMSSKHYMNTQMKNNAWRIIGTEMNKTGEECQKIWSNIRNNFRKALNNRKTKSGDPYTKRRPIKFEKELEFLKKFIQHRKQTSNLDSSSEDTQTSFAESAVVDSDERSVSRMTNDSHHSSIIPEPTTTAEILNKYIESKKEVDAIDSFFQTMAATVKKLPKREQVRIKRQIFNMVTDAELNYIEGTPAPTSEDVSTNLQHQRPCRTAFTSRSGCGTAAGLGYEAVSGSGYETTSRSGYETTSRSGYEAASGSDFGTASGSCYEAASGSGFGTASGSGYEAASGSGFGTASGSGYEPASRSGYETASGPGYEAASGSGYKTAVSEYETNLN